MRRPRVLVVVVCAVAVIGALFLFVLPGRTYLAQRHNLHADALRIKVLARANDQLDQQIKQLQSDAEVERLARQQYGLVKPGEIPYVIQPPTPPAAPPPPLRAPRRGYLAQLWRDLQFWE